MSPRGPMRRDQRLKNGAAQGRAAQRGILEYRFRWENNMKLRVFVCALCCAVSAACLLSGCSEVNTGHETNLAKLPPPQVGIGKRASRSFSSDKRNQQLARQLAGRSSPPIVHH